SYYITALIKKDTRHITFNLHLTFGQCGKVTQKKTPQCGNYYSRPFHCKILPQNCPSFRRFNQSEIRKIKNDICAIHNIFIFLYL
ncbi:MAG TPA: hypothetical protein P5270_03315, partial [Victivallales bacterium]|nr:hypothetical protein [Victivallales bacterium]